MHAFESATGNRGEDMQDIACFELASLCLFDAGFIEHYIGILSNIAVKMDTSLRKLFLQL